MLVTLGKHLKGPFLYLSCKGKLICDSVAKYLLSPAQYGTPLRPRPGYLRWRQWWYNHMNAGHYLIQLSVVHSWWTEPSDFFLSAILGQQFTWDFLHICLFPKTHFSISWPACQLPVCRPGSFLGVIQNWPPYLEVRERWKKEANPFRLMAGLISKGTYVWGLFGVVQDG